MQGFNFLIPARDVVKFLQGTEVRPGESRFSPVWSAGLEALFAGRYSTALARFEEANRLLPNLAGRQARAGRGRCQGQEPAAPALPVGLDHVRGHAAQRRRLRRHRRPALVAEPFSGVADAGDRVHGTGAQPGARRRAQQERLRDEPAQASRRRSPRAVRGARPVASRWTSSPGSSSSPIARAPRSRPAPASLHLLRQRGFGNVRILKGGLGGWTNARLPVEAKSSLPSIGLELYKNLTLGDMERRKFKAGEVIFKEGDNPRGEAYVIHAGTVEIRRRFDGTERVLATLGEGELMGDMALFRASALRSASAVAQSDVELLILKSERLDWLIHNRPQLTKELLRRLSEMVVATDANRAGRAAG